MNSRRRNCPNQRAPAFFWPALYCFMLLIADGTCRFAVAADAEPPMEWIEPQTGHRVLRLSKEPGTYSFYFHQNAYTAKGDMIVVGNTNGLATIDLKSHEQRQIVTGRCGQVVVGRKSREVFYTREGAVYATSVDTGQTREIMKFPPGAGRGSGFGINADETLLGGSYVIPGNTNRPGTGSEDPARTPPEGQRRGRKINLDARLEMRLPMTLYTIDIKTGKLNTFHTATDWLNHVQFSPTDPTLMMFCHEGPWHKVDRIWTIRTDGTELRKIHERTMDMEIAGHEFFSQDGKIVWFDLQTPKGKEFWLAGVVLATGEKIRYKVQRDQWSVHYNAAPDGKHFMGDGGGPESVAAPGNGQWMYYFTPGDGQLKGERLVDLSRHEYWLEPNGTFTPDGKWIIFRSNMHGATYVYAVEVEKAK